MFGFPLDVPWIGCTEYILLLLVVEDNAIVLVFNHLHVFVQQKVHDVELSVGEAEEVFELDGDAAGRRTEHAVAF